MTNGDKVRNMTNEELAEMLDNVCPPKYLSKYRFCGDRTKTDCLKCWETWLLEELEEAEPKLKPCPFCGGDVKLEGSDNLNYWFVVCDSCGASVYGDRDKAVAIERWNRRA